MEDLKTIMLKSPKIKAIRLTENNINKIVYTLRGMGLIQERYNTQNEILYYGTKKLANLEVGDWVACHPDKSLAIITNESYLKDYMYW